MYEKCRSPCENSQRVAIPEKNETKRKNIKKKNDFKNEINLKNETKREIIFK